MPTERIHLIGAGGHARVVIDALLRLGRPRRAIALWTESSEQVGTSFAGLTIALLDLGALAGEAFHVCIGNNQARGRIHRALEQVGGLATTIVHPAAIPALDAEIAAGSFLAAGAIVGPNASIGLSCIINHGAIVDHDCIVRDFAHIAPGATLGGAVRIDTGVLVGAGANILPGKCVAERSTVGAGAVVITNVPAASVVVGVPAKPVHQEATHGYQHD